MLNAKHLIVLAIVLALSLSTYAQFPPVLPMYQDSYYQGPYFDTQCLNCGFTSFGPYGWNDRVSSLIVPSFVGNHTWINMFDLTNYGGEFRTFGANPSGGSALIYDLITYRFNDKMASATVHSLLLADTPTLTVYENENYGGASIQLYPHSYSTLSNFGWGNRISSFKMSPLSRAVFWQSAGNYSGITLQYQASVFGPLEVPSMIVGWNDAINCIVFGTV